MLLMLLLIFSGRRRTIIYVPVEMDRSLSDELAGLLLLVFIGGLCLWWFSN